MTSEKCRSCLSRNAGNVGSEKRIKLRLAMLGCEPSPPYGPNEHTAELMMDLVSKGATQHSEQVHWMITITIYDVQQEEYPNSWDEYDGYLVPGSFSSAYDKDPWITKLCTMIQKEIVAKQRPTLAICFGHQVLAHSFQSGKATKTPSGPRAGRYTMSTTEQGCQILGSPSIDLLFTHGDMVEFLPPSAVSLGGSDTVPIQSAAYYGTPEHAPGEGDQERTRPYAVSFQAHPEFAGSIELGVQNTLEKIMDAMQQRGQINKEHRQNAAEDAHAQFLKIQQDSLNSMAMVGKLLGWYPAMET